MIIKYVCECCDRLVEEVFVSENLVNLFDDEEGTTDLTGINPEDIMNLERQGSLVLQTMCPECLAEFNLDEGAGFSPGTSVIN